MKLKIIACNKSGKWTISDLFYCSFFNYRCFKLEILIDLKNNCVKSYQVPLLYGFESNITKRNVFPFYSLKIYLFVRKIPNEKEKWKKIRDWIHSQLVVSWKLKMWERMNKKYETKLVTQPMEITFFICRFNNNNND